MKLKKKLEKNEEKLESKFSKFSSNSQGETDKEKETIRARGETKREQKPKVRGNRERES